LINKLSLDFPAISFAPGDTFSWSPDAGTVFYGDITPETSGLLIHELAHGLLGHRAYSRDVELLALESAAWEKAAEIAPRYGVTITEDDMQDNLDTYREWMHARSTCPECEATGIQTGPKTYRC